MTLEKRLIQPKDMSTLVHGEMDKSSTHELAITDFPREGPMALKVSEPNGVLVKKKKKCGFSSPSPDTSSRGGRGSGSGVCICPKNPSEP